MPVLINTTQVCCGAATSRYGSMKTWCAIETSIFFLSHKVLLRGATPFFTFYIYSLNLNADLDLQPHYELNILILVSLVHIKMGLIEYPPSFVVAASLMNVPSFSWWVIPRRDRDRALVYIYFSIPPYPWEQYKTLSNASAKVGQALDYPRSGRRSVTEFFVGP